MNSQLLPPVLREVLFLDQSPDDSFKQDKLHLGSKAEVMLLNAERDAQTRKELEAKRLTMKEKGTAALQAVRSGVTAAASHYAAFAHEDILNPDIDPKLRAVYFAALGGVAVRNYIQLQRSARSLFNSISADMDVKNARDKASNR